MRSSYHRGDMTQVYLPLKSRFCGLGSVVWFQGCLRSTGLPSGSFLTNVSELVPVVVVRAAQQDANAEIDLHQVGGDQLAVDHDSGGDVHRPAPLGHVLVGVIADVGVLERAPAAQQDAPAADLLVAGQRLVEEVEEVVVQRHDLLHELDVLHQPDEVVGEELDRGHRADASRIKGRRVDVPAFHQAEHLAGHPAHLQGFAIETAGERVEGPHDVGDRAIAVQIGVGRLGSLGRVEDARVGLLDHLLAEIDADQVILEDVVIEHVLGRFAQVDDPFGDGGRPDAEGHVLGVARRRWRGCRRRCRRSGW